MKQSHQIWISFIVMACLFPGFVWADMPISEIESQAIVQRIRQKTMENSERVASLSYQEDSTTTVTNSKTGELDETYRVIQIRTRQFGIADKVERLRYFKNDEELPVSELDDRNEEPFYEVFSADGADRFDARVTGKEKIRGHECYQVEITAREKTDKHFEGTMFFSIDQLLLVRMEGTLADLPFGVKKLTMTIDQMIIDGVSVPLKSIIETDVHVPFIYPNKSILIVSQVSHQNVTF